MSASVDERIVQMQFDNQAFESGVSQTLGSLDKLNSSINGLSGNDFNGLGDTIDDIGNRFSNLGVIGMTVLSNLTNKVVDMGLNFASSLTIDQMSAGFAKYASETKDVKALMNSINKEFDTEAEKMDYIEDKLGALAWYSDSTSYSYSAMVSAMKSFSAQNIDLDEAVPMIEGIGNSLSYAGLAAEEASSAFSIYSKAIGQGYMSNIQWKSLNLMGASTAGLKQQFIDAGLALGTLKQDADGTIKTMEGLEVSVEQFDSTLSNAKGKWLTTDVMKAVFGGDYGSYTQGLYDMSQALEKISGAQIDVNTQMEIYDSIAAYKSADTVKTYELAVAKVADALNVSTDKAREYVDAIKDSVDATDNFGKRAFLAAQEARTFSEAVNAVKDAASSAWKTIFGNIFGNAEEATEMWTAFSTWLYDSFMGSLELAAKVTSKWKELGGRDSMIEMFSNFAKAIDSVVDPIKKAFASIFGALNINELGQRLVDFTNKMRDFAANLILNEETAAKLQKIFEGLFAALDIVKTVIGYVIRALGTLFHSVTPVTGSITDLLVKIAEWIVKLRDFLKENEQITKGLDAINNGIEKVSDGLNPIASVLDFITGLVDKAFEKVKLLGTAIKEYFGPILSNSLGNGTAIVSVLGAIVGLKALKFNVLDPIKALMDIPKSIAAVFDSLSGALDVFATEKMVKGLRNVAISIALLAASLLLLSSINPDKLATGLAGLGSMLLMVKAFMTELTAMSKTVKGTGLIKLSVVLIPLAAAVLILSFALKKLAGLDFAGLAKGVAGIGILMQELGAFMKQMNGEKLKLTSAIAVIFLATGLLIMTKAVEKLGSLDLPTLVKGLISVAVLLKAITVFSSKLNPKGMMSAGIGVIFIGTGLLIMSKAVEKLGSMDLPTLAKGLGAIALALLGIVGFMKLMPASGMIANSSALLIASVALIAIAGAIKILAGLELKQVGIALLALGGGLAELAIALNFMNGTLGGAAALLVAALAIGVLTPSLVILGKLKLSEIGKALLALGGALAIFGVAAVVLGPLIPVMLGLAAAMALFGVAVGAFGLGMTLLATSTVAGTAALIGSFQMILAAIPSTLTLLVGAISTLVIAVCIAIKTTIPMILETVVDLLIQVLTTLNDNLPMILDMGITMILTLIEGFTVALPKLVQAAFNLVITFIESLTITLQENQDRFLTAIENLVLAVIELVFKGLSLIATDMLPKAIEIVGRFITGWLDSLPKLYHVITDMVKGIFDRIKVLKDKFFTVAKNCISGFIKGIKEGLTSIGSAVTNMASTAVKAVTNFFGINSPSKVFEEIAGYTVDGFVLGINSGITKVERSADDLGDAALTSMTDALSGVSDLMDQDLGTEVEITPVLNLSEIQNGSRVIENMLGGRRLAASLDTNINTNNTDYALLDKLDSLNAEIKRLADKDDQFNDLGDQIKEALAGVGIYMDRNKVGKLVSVYQSNVRRAGGV